MYTCIVDGAHSCCTDFPAQLKLASWHGSVCACVTQERVTAAVTVLCSLSVTQVPTSVRYTPCEIACVTRSHHRGHSQCLLQTHLQHRPLCSHEQTASGSSLDGICLSSKSTHCAWQVHKLCPTRVTQRVLHSFRSHSIGSSHRAHSISVTPVSYSVSSSGTAQTYQCVSALRRCSTNGGCDPH